MTTAAKKKRSILGVKTQKPKKTQKTSPSLVLLRKRSGGREAGRPGQGRAQLAQLLVARTNSRRPRGRCCVKRGARQRSATQEASEIATESPRRRGEAKSPGTGNSARQHSGLFSFPNPGVPEQEKKRGMRDPQSL